jgi:hypothetical protein
LRFSRQQDALRLPSKALCGVAKISGKFVSAFQCFREFGSRRIGSKRDTIVRRIQFDVLGSVSSFFLGSSLFSNPFNAHTVGTSNGQRQI